MNQIMELGFVIQSNMNIEWGLVLVSLLYGNGGCNSQCSAWGFNQQPMEVSHLYKSFREINFDNLVQIQNSFSLSSAGFERLLFSIHWVLCIQYNPQNWKQYLMYVLLHYKALLKHAKIIFRNHFLFFFLLFSFSWKHLVIFSIKAKAIVDLILNESESK